MRDPDDRIPGPARPEPPGSDPEPGAAATCRVAVNAERIPHEPAIVGRGTQFSWGELDALIRRRTELQENAPAVTLLRAERSVDFVVRIFAAARRGRVIALVPPRLPPGPAERFALDTGAEFVEQFPASGAVPSDGPGRTSGAASSGAAARAGSLAPISAPDAPLTYIRTSGSTGRARVIAHSWRNHTASAAWAAQALMLTSGDRWLWSLPPHHVGGLSIVFRCVQAGAAIVLPGAEEGVRLRSLIEETHSTIVSCVPVQLQRMIDDGACPSALRDVIVGGAPIEAGLIADALSAGYPVRTTYGCTESASMITLSARFAQAPAVVHAGKPFCSGTVDVAADGTIRIRGPVVAIGEIREGELHAIADDDGWFETGDLGEFDATGRLIVAGRKDDVFISGGENISARELEAALAHMAGVRSAVVVPVPSAEFGSRPAAFLDTDGPMPDPHVVRRHLDEHVPRFMHPDIVLPLGPPPEGRLKWPRHLLIERAARASGTA